jgi:hypothetical protein
MKITIILLLLFVSFTSYSKNSSDKVRYKGKFYTVVYKGVNYTTLQDAQGETILVNFKNK